MSCNLQFIFLKCLTYILKLLTIKDIILDLTKQFKSNHEYLLDMEYKYL